MMIIVALVGYGIYINYTSGKHVAKMTAAQYVRVRGATVAYREIRPVIYFPAINLYAPKMSDMHFQLEGTITRIYVKQGDRVQPGQLLAEIVNNEMAAQVLQAEGKISSAESSVIRWGNMRNRYKMLEGIGGVSRQQIEEVESNLQSAQGELAASKAYRDQLVTRLGYQQLVAPYEGDILKIYHAPGAVVRSGDSLLLIGELSSLYFRSKIADSEFEQLQLLAGAAQIAIKSNELGDKAYAAVSQEAVNAGQASEFAVQITEVAPPPEVSASYRTVVFQINNAAGLLEPGTYHQAKIFPKEQRRVMAVPKEAIVEEKQQPTVFVIGADSRLELRHIKTGVRDENYVEVLEGVSENETVLISTDEDDEFSPGMKVRLVQAESQ